MAVNKLIEKKIDELMGVEKSPPQKPHRRLMMWLTTTCILILIIVGVTLAMTPQPTTSEPHGKITAPASITETGRKIQITGYTKNLPPDRPYVLIAVDVKKKYGSILRTSQALQAGIHPITLYAIRDSGELEVITEPGI